MNHKEKRPAGGPGGSRKITSGAVIVAFPLETAICECCGTTFNRRRAETWKKLCLDCWRWSKAGALMSRASRLLREVR